MASLLPQIRGVECVLNVARGPQAELQKQALGQLQEELVQAREAAKHAKDSTTRKRALERDL